MDTRTGRPRQIARKERNVAVLAEDVAAGRRMFRAFPDVVSLHTTNVCNLRCMMCPRADGPGRLRLPVDVLARTCDELFPTARRAVFSPAHGEPLLSDFHVVMDAALRHGVFVDLVTNGTLLTADVYRRTRAALNVVNVSIDSHLPATYERIRVGARFASLDRRLREILAVRRAEPDRVLWSASAVVMRSNLDHLPGFVAYAARRGFHAVVLQPLRQSRKPIPHEDPLRTGHRGTNRGRQAAAAPVEVGAPDAGRRLARRFGEAEAAARAVGVNLYFSDFQRPSVEVRQLRPRAEIGNDDAHACWSLFRNFSIQPTGDVYACCHPTDHRLGNLRNQSASGIWNGPRMQRLRVAHFTRRGTGFCNGCIHAPYLPAPRPGAVPSALRLARIARTYFGDRLRHALRG